MIHLHEGYQIPDHTANQVESLIPDDCDRIRPEGHYASYRRILTQRGVSHNITISHGSPPLTFPLLKHKFQSLSSARPAFPRGGSCLDRPADHCATGKRAWDYRPWASFPHHTPQVISSLKLNPSNVVNYHLKIAVCTTRRVKGYPRHPRYPITTQYENNGGPEHRNEYVYYIQYHICCIS